MFSAQGNALIPTLERFGDLTPTLDEYLGGRQITREVRTYRDISYVTEQVRYLAQQIKELAK